jgi:poly-gamma-glutamate synthesis protein (capsule biosynthesis protein)
VGDEASGTVVLAVGDVILNRDDPASMFHSVGEVLRGGDITFGNCETPYPERLSRNPVTAYALWGDVSNVPALREIAGFDVMAFANNHTLDHNYEGLESTLQLLRGNGIATCGAGDDIDEARKPAIVEHNGTRVAFLAYNSILFEGYAADVGEAGAAPLRVHTHYEHIEHEQPGTAPKIYTFPDPSDLAALLEDVRNAKAQADVVALSVHWGLHFVPALIADYESVVARAAIDAGADIILGHHAHILKGIDSYRGKVIFHNLGNFAMDVPKLREGRMSSPKITMLYGRYPNFLQHHDDYPSYPFPVDARKTLIVKIGVMDGEVQRVSFLPCHIEPDNTPRILAPDEPLFDEVVEYMQSIGEEAGLTAGLQVDGPEVVVTPVE